MGCICTKKQDEIEYKKRYKPEDNLNNEIEIDEKQISLQIQAQNEMKLQHIIESIYDAAVKAHNNVQLNNLHNLFWLLPKNESGIHVPKCIPIEVPNDSDTKEATKIINVPLITLVNQQNLNINELKITTKVDIELLTSPKSENCQILGLNKKDYSLNLVPGNKSTQIEMFIKMEPPLEVYSRILAKLEKQI